MRVVSHCVVYEHCSWAGWTAAVRLRWLRVNEDMLVHRHPLPQEDWSCADMTFFETASGGAVFSVGSMTYAGSLMIDDGRSVLGQLTANVVRRFADPTPFVLPVPLTQ
jgi:N,N-dimethylformamidase